MKIKALLKPRTTLDWQPNLRGNIYCSSACGGHCKRSEYDALTKLGDDVVCRLKTKGWVANVSENLGWHVSWTNELCGISLHYSKHDKTFWCMMASGDVKAVSSGSGGIDFSGHFKDPNKAVAEQIKLAVPWFEAQVRGLNNLFSII